MIFDMLMNIYIITLNVFCSMPITFKNMKVVYSDS